MTDPIADMLIRIKNAQAVRHSTVEIPYSKIKYEIANMLLNEGFLEKVERKFRRKTKKVIKITLKYKNKQPVIQGLRRISKPGRRIYLPYKLIRSPKGGLGVAVISTPLGLMTDKEARKRKLGGEVLCEVW
jgi:small subunit ribosomal protein S8